jgi:hypothetical protein
MSTLLYTKSESLFMTYKTKKKERTWFTEKLPGGMGKQKRAQMTPLFFSAGLLVQKFLLFKKAIGLGHWVACCNCNHYWLYAIKLSAANHPTGC